MARAMFLQGPRGQATYVPTYTHTTQPPSSAARHGDTGGNPSSFPPAQCAVQKAQGEGSLPMKSMPNSQKCSAQTILPVVGVQCSQELVPLFPYPCNHPASGSACAAPLMQ